jgi:hypothetical protein
LAIGAVEETVEIVDEDVDVGAADVEAERMRRRSGSQLPSLVVS